MIIGQIENSQPQRRTTPAPYLIAMCDVLGFSRLFEKKTSEALKEVYEKYLRLRTQVQEFQGVVGLAPRAAEPLPVLDGVVFSDTILFWAPATGAMEILAMNLCVLMLQAMRFGLPLRVGLAFGECVIDSANDIYIGRPIIDAYRTENRQEWMGGAYHPTCWELPGFLEQLCHWRTAVRYPVPVKPPKPGEEVDPLLEYALGWTLLADEDVSASLDKQEQDAPAKDKVKWQNARVFCEAQRR